jgi:prepilin-type N-terminal cleavage/methylation domain-containing protein
MSNIKKRSEGGFTIIEVLIVLAIAGLIMLIVFLAVPALQRNSRNTQIKNAASSVLGAVSEFQNNNNGSMPTTVATNGDTVTVSGATGTTSASAKVQGGFTAVNGTAMPTATGSMTVYFNRQCNGNAFAGTATQRAVAIGYLIEGASGTAPQCQES